MLNKFVFRVAIVLSLSAAAYGENACVDQTQTIYRDNLEFVKSWENCGRSSLGFTDPFSACLKAKHVDVSTACINCFSQFVSCTRSNCLFSCIGFSKSWCEKCALDNCQEPLTECTGVSKEALPSKYPKTVIIEK